MTPDPAMVTLAWEARSQAYAPYSNFPVGAVAIGQDQSVHTGCNVENISFGLTNCAERVAIQKAITKGTQSFQTVYVVAETDEPISPCGACRQVMAEFGVTHIVSSNRQTSLIFSLEEILPRATTGILNRE